MLCIVGFDECQTDFDERALNKKLNILVGCV